MLPVREAGISDPIRHQRPNPQHRLHQTRNNPANTSMCNLRLEQGHNLHQDANSQARDEPSNIEHCNVFGSCLEYTANEVDAGPEGNDLPPPEAIRETCGEGTEKGPSGEQSNDSSAFGGAVGLEEFGDEGIGGDDGRDHAEIVAVSWSAQEC